MVGSRRPIIPPVTKFRLIIRRPVLWYLYTKKITLLKIIIQSIQSRLISCQFNHTKRRVLIVCYVLFFRLFQLFLDQSWRRGTKSDCKTDWLWVRSPFEDMKFLLKFIFPFFRSGIEAKRGVEFCNATRIRQKVGNGVC